MVQTPDLGASLCSITPSDQAGSIDNILSRLEALEQAVRELQSQNVNANQLSDISPSVGWVYDVTYMGTPGWTQTQAGTLIPPVGVSLSSLGLLMSDGNPFQIVGVDANGALTFGINPQGGSDSSGLSIAYFQGSGGSSFPITMSWTTIRSASFVTNNTTSLGISSGLYLLAVSSDSYILRSGTVTTSNEIRIRVGSPISGTEDIKFGAYWIAGEPTTSPRSMSGAKVCRFPDALSGTNITGVCTKVGTPTVTIPTTILGIIRLAD